MKITVEQSILSEVFNKVSKFISKTSQLPILQGVLINATEDCIQFTASDNTESLLHEVPVDTETVVVREAGAVVLPKAAIDVMKKLSGALSLEVNDEQMLSIATESKGRKKEFLYSYMNAEEYPKLPKIREERTIKVLGEQFQKMVNSTIFATAKSEARPILQGVCMTFNEMDISAVATDSYRLGQYNIKGLGIKDEIRITVPGQLLDKAVKSFEPEDDVLITIDETRIMFSSGRSTLITRLIEGNYPDTSRLIPDTTDTELTVNRKELLNELDIFSTVKDVCTIRVTDTEVVINASGDISKGEAFLFHNGLEGNYQDLKITFSAKYLMDALKALDSNDVVFHFNGGMRPVLIYPHLEEPQELQLVLPVRSA